MDTRIPHRIRMDQSTEQVRYFPMHLTMMWLYHDADDKSTLCFDTVDEARAFIVTLCERRVALIENHRPRHPEFDTHIALAKKWVEEAKVMEVGSIVGQAQ